MTASAVQIDAFIVRWQGREGGQERANYGLFLTELCDVLGVPHPEPAAASTQENDYVFERAVTGPGDGRLRRAPAASTFTSVAASSSKPSSRARPAARRNSRPSTLPGLEPPERGARDASRTWDVLMLNARRQAEGYARALPVSHGWPPFILVCDVGHVIETYADFSGQGKNYAQFPDRQSFRIYLEDLRRVEIRERLARIWTDPMQLDPARETARVTRAIAERLAAVSKALEEQGARGGGGGDVPHALPVHHVRRGCRTAAQGQLSRCAATLRAGPVAVPSTWSGQLWEAMDKRRVSPSHWRPRCGASMASSSAPAPPCRCSREEIGELRARGRVRLAAKSILRSSARCWNRRWTRPNGAGSARIIRRAPMSSGWWSPP